MNVIQITREVYDTLNKYIKYEGSTTTYTYLELNFSNMPA